jgi:hypothetical protein
MLQPAAPCTGEKSWKTKRAGSTVCPSVTTGQSHACITGRAPTWFYMWQSQNSVPNILVHVLPHPSVPLHAFNDWASTVSPTASLPSHTHERMHHGQTILLINRCQNLIMPGHKLLMCCRTVYESQTMMEMHLQHALQAPVRKAFAESRSEIQQCFFLWSVVVLRQPPVCALQTPCAPLCSCQLC